MVAIIFDMDGVISDTQRVHAKIESEILCEIGIDMLSDTITKRFSGVPDLEMFKTILAESGKTADISALLEKKEKQLESELKLGISEIPGATWIIKKFHEEGILLAVATSMKKRLMKLVLEKLGIGQYFSAAISVDDVSKGKPDPEIFLKAASSLGRQPQDCIVIEDGESGIKGAKKAGMTTIGFGKNVRGLGTYSAGSMKDVEKIIEKYHHSKLSWP